MPPHPGCWESQERDEYKVLGLQRALCLPHLFQAYSSKVRGWANSLLLSGAQVEASSPYSGWHSSPGERPPLSPYSVLCASVHRGCLTPMLTGRWCDPCVCCAHPVGNVLICITVGNVLSVEKQGAGIVIALSFLSERLVRGVACESLAVKRACTTLTLPTQPWPCPYIQLHLQRTDVHTGLNATPSPAYFLHP